MTTHDGGCAAVEHPLNLASRSEEEERLVRFAYFARMAAHQWERHPAAASLLEYGLDVKAELEGVEQWFVAERQRLFPQFLGMNASHNASSTPAD